MPSCEKCWEDAGKDPYKDKVEEYHRLIRERDASENVCTPEQQAGRDAGVCPRCNRRALHQWTNECMKCQYEGTHDGPVTGGEDE